MDWRDHTDVNIPPRIALLIAGGKVSLLPSLLEFFDSKQVWHSLDSLTRAKTAFLRPAGTQ
jgi:hypothetical protein